MLCSDMNRLDRVLVEDYGYGCGRETITAPSCREMMFVVAASQREIYKLIRLSQKRLGCGKKVNIMNLQGDLSDTGKFKTRI